jgi:hypothetical protein
LTVFSSFADCPPGFLFLDPPDHAWLRKLAHCACTAVLGTNTNVRRPSRRAASNPIIVFPAPGGRTK